MQSRISFRLPMLTFGGVKPWTGSKMHSAGRTERSTRSISGVPNFSLRSTPERSPAKSGVKMRSISAPATRSFLRSFLRTLSSVVRNRTLAAFLVKPGGSRMQDFPLLRAAMMWHQRVVLPIPPSAASRAICPSGIQPGMSHFASSSGKSLRLLNRESSGSGSAGGRLGGCHCGVSRSSSSSSRAVSRAPLAASRSDRSPCSGMSGQMPARSATRTDLAAPCRAAAVSWAKARPVVRQDDHRQAPQLFGVLPAPLARPGPVRAGDGAAAQQGVKAVRVLLPLHDVDQPAQLPGHIEPVGQPLPVVGPLSAACGPPPGEALVRVAQLLRQQLPGVVPVVVHSRGLSPGGGPVREQVPDRQPQGRRDVPGVASGVAPEQHPAVRPDGQRQAVMAVVVGGAPGGPLSAAALHALQPVQNLKNIHLSISPPSQEPVFTSAGRCPAPPGSKIGGPRRGASQIGEVLGEGCPVSYNRPENFSAGGGTSQPPPLLSSIQRRGP